MRTVKLSSGVEIEVRGLKRTERKRDMGFGPVGYDFALGRTNDACDYVLDLLGIDVDALPDDDSTPEASILKAVILETYGVRDEEKNLSRSGSPGQTESA